MENNEARAEALIMPDMILYKTLKSIFKIIKDDYNDSPLVQKTILYNFFGKDVLGEDLQFETFNYFKQAKEAFVDQNISVNIGYNLEVAQMGCVHILLPNETGRDLAIGADENYQPNIKDTNGKNTYKNQYTQRFDCTYNLMITSENTMHVILIYNLLKASLISINYHLELSGLRNPKLGGQDIQMQSNLVPDNIFHRSLLLSFMYECSVPDLLSRKFVKSFMLTGINTVNNL